MARWDAAITMLVMAMFASSPNHVQGAMCPDWQNVLNAHNSVRAKHKAAPLAWDQGLANKMSAWAEKLVNEGCNMVHSRNGNGENLATVPTPYLRNRQQCQFAFDMWANEGKRYKFSSTPARDNNFFDIGHFTQVVWKGTKKVGCGVAMNSRCVIAGCQYSPPGNVVTNSAFLTNVKRP